MKQFAFIFILLSVSFLCNCKKETGNKLGSFGSPYFLDLPDGFPSPIIPEDNKLTVNRVKLGKKLFFDPILSKDYTISCSSCHLPSNSFSDVKNLSAGVEGRKGFRNSPSIANVAYNKFFFKDGGSPTLELQVVGPIQDHNEMDINILAVTERLLKDKEYVRLSKLAYNREPGPFVITRAIAAFERTLISGNSNFDKYNNGDLNALTPSQIRGKSLFFSNKTNCSSCHSGFNFTNYTFQNIGLYPKYPDSGRMRISEKIEDRGKFVVPSLRNIEVTSPYMHDGSINTLEEVIDFFDTGGHSNPNKSNLIKPLHLSANEKIDLVNFLNSLTDKEFLTNFKFKK